MSAAKLLNTDAAKYAAVAVVAAIALYLVGRKVAGAVADNAATIGNAVNPVSDRNIFYRGTNAVGGALSGSADWSLGSWLYDVTHDDYDPNAPAQAAGSVDTQAPGNVAAYEDSWSLGSWLYDVTHPNDYDPNAPDRKTTLANNYTLGGVIDWIWPDPK